MFTLPSYKQLTITINLKTEFIFILGSICRRTRYFRLLSVRRRFDGEMRNRRPAPTRKQNIGENFVKIGTVVTVVFAITNDYDFVYIRRVNVDIFFSFV